MPNLFQTNDQLVLNVWGPGWGLPSIDTESLQAMTYVRFSGAPVTFQECENPWKSVERTIPFIKVSDSKYLYSASEIASHLRQKNFSCDFDLSPKQGADVAAYSQLIAESLEPALKYFCWVHETNFESVVRPCYASRLPWLYKTWYPDRIKKRASSYIQSLYHEARLNPELSVPFILRKAQQCINLLSDKLNDNEFFMFPNSPTTLDAVIFSHLAPFLKIPLPDCPVKEYIRSTPNLERFVARILHRYFSKLTGPNGDTIYVHNTSETLFGRDGRPSLVKKEEALFPTYHKFIVIAIGAIAMLAFAYRNGMVNFQIQSEPVDEDGEDDDQLIWE